MDDRELLREYAAHQSENAFNELVARHISLVHSTALRVVGDPQLAKDVVQAVFIDLARKPGAVGDPNTLAGWLYRVTRHTAAKALRTEHRRRQRESQAMELNSTKADPETVWQSLAPQLEEAMDALEVTDQNAVVLRFFQGKSLKEVGEALSLTDDAAQKRVSRALEKLRSHFSSRGIETSSALLGTVLAVHAVQAVPLSMATSVAATSLGGVSSATATGLGVILEAMLMTKTKIAIVTALLVAMVVTPVAWHHVASARRTWNANQVYRIHGVARDAEGNPVQGAVVCLLPMTDASVQTDGRGEFDVGFTPKHAMDKGKLMTPFYALVRDAAQSRVGLVELAGPGRSLNVTLKPAISGVGKVSDERGAGIQGVKVTFSLNPAGAPYDSWFAAGSTATDELGLYEMPALPELPGGSFGMRVRWAPGEKGDDWIGGVRMAADPTRRLEAWDRNSSATWTVQRNEAGRIELPDVVVAQGRARFR